MTPMLPNLKEKIKSLEHEIFVVFVAVLLTTLIAGLYLLFNSRKEKEPIRYEQNAFTLSSDVATSVAGNLFVASKNGSKYYPSNCAAARRIKEENRIFFATIFEAEQAGYTRTTTCK